MPPQAHLRCSPVGDGDATLLRLMFLDVPELFYLQVRLNESAVPLGCRWFVEVG
jgi:hypothetical protein